MANTFKVGDMTIHRIVEMECGFTPALEFLPELKPEVLEENRSWLAPSALDAAGQPGAVLPVLHRADAGVTPSWWIAASATTRSAPRGRCGTRRRTTPSCAAWRRLGLTVNDIDFVMCTHLHVDHVGWNTRLENGRWVPTFPKARYLFSKTELDFWLAENDKAELPPIVDSVIPIVEAKRCDLVTSDHAVDDLVSLIPTPGHTIDHYAVQLGRGGKDAVITGDLIHTPLQARYPELAMRVDYDPKQGAATRRKFLETYCDTSTLCCFAHFPTPSRGHIKRWGDGFKCDYVAA